MLIDAHAHVFRPAAVSPRGVDALAPADRDAPLEHYRARLAVSGIDGAVLVPLDTHDDAVAEALEHLPGSFTGVAVAGDAEQGRDGGDPVVALRARRERFGFRAVRTMWLGDPDRSIAESPMWPALRHLSDEGIVLWSYVTPDQTGLLTEVGERLPELRVVLNHLGFAPHDMRVDGHGRPAFDDPFPASEVERVVRLADHPGFHLMFSGHYALSTEPYPYPDLHATGARLVGLFGAERTLWGSDWPWIDVEPGHARMHRLVDIALPDLVPRERADILGGTAARLLDLGPAGRAGAAPAAGDTAGPASAAPAGFAPTLPTTDPTGGSGGPDRSAAPTTDGLPGPGTPPPAAPDGAPPGDAPAVPGGTTRPAPGASPPDPSSGTR